MNAMKLSLSAAVTLAALLSTAPAPVRAASGTWTGAAGATWTTDGNWSVAPYPVGGETATFSGAGNGNTTVDLAGLTSIGAVVFDTAAVAPYTLGAGGAGAQTLVLTNGGLIQLTASAWNDQAVQAAVQLGLDRATASYTLRNDSAYRTLALTGAVSGPAAGGTAGTKTLAVIGAGGVTISGALSKGGASALNVTNALTAGALTLSASNTVKTFYMTGNANNTVNLAAGELFIDNLGSTALYSTQGGVINGPGKIRLSTTTNHNYADNYIGSGKTLVINASIGGTGGFEMWSGTGTFVFNGVNDFAQNVIIGPAGTISVSSIGNKGSTTSNLGQGTNITFNANGSRLLYTGAGEVTDRILNFKANGVVEHAGSGHLTFATNVSASSGAKTVTLRVASPATAEFTGLVRNDAGTLSLTKEGTGSWTLSAANTYSGNTLVSAGTLRLAGAGGAASSTNFTLAAGGTLKVENAASANSGNRLGDAATVTLRGGTLEFAHDAGGASFSESVGALVVDQGAGTISVDQAAEGQTASLTFASLARLGTATVNFAGAGLGASGRCRIFITGQPDGVIGPWATINGTDLAAYSSALGVIPASTSGQYTDIAARGSVIPNTPGADVRINSSGSGDPIALAAATTVIETLQQNTATDATVDTASKALLADNLVLLPSTASVTVGLAANDGTLAPATAGGTLLLANESDAVLTVNAQLADNGAASSLLAYGSGPIVLVGSNTFSGATSVAGGTLTLANSHALQNSTLLSADVVFDESVSSHAFTLGSLNGTLSLNLEDNAASPNPVALTVGNNGASVTHSGTFGGAGSLVKAGSGTLTLSTANTYSGGTAVRGGQLTVSHVSGLGTGAVVNDALLDLTVGNATYSGLSTALSGTGTVSVTLGGTTGTTYLDGDYSGFTGVWNLGKGVGGKARMNGADNPAATIHVRTNGTVWVSAATVHQAALVLYGGNTGEAYGQLRLDNDAAWAGPVTLFSNITDSADGFFGSAVGTGVISGVISDLNGAHEVAKVGAGRVYLMVSNNTYAGQTWIKGGGLGAVALNDFGVASSFGQPADATAATIKLGSGTTSGRLVYLGSGETTARVLDLASTTASNVLEQAGSGPLVFTSDLSVSGVGNKTFILDGNTSADGEFAGVITNGVGSTVSVGKTGSGTWRLSGVNSYSGPTYLWRGTLVAENPQALGTGTITFPATTATLDLAHDGSAPTANVVSMNGGTVATLLSGNSGGTVGVNHLMGPFSLSTVTVNVRRSDGVEEGSPAITTPSLDLSSGGGGNTIFVPTDADLHIGSVAIRSNGGNAKGVLLDGTSGASSIFGPVSNGLNTVSLTKANVGTWALYGSNTYSGATTVNGGSLVHYGQHTGSGTTTVNTNALYVMAGTHSGGGAVAVSGGTLDIIGTIGAVTASSGVTLSKNGTLKLSNSAGSNRTDRLGDAVPVTLAGGALHFSHDGGAADYAEQLGALTVSGGSNLVATSRAAADRTSALTLASLARTGGTVDFVGEGLGADTRNQVLFTNEPALVNGIIGPWATVNGSALATYGVYGVKAYAGYTDLLALGPSTLGDDATLNARINAEGSGGGINLAGDPVNSVNTLSQNTAFPSTLSLSNRVLRASGVRVSPGQASLTLGDAAGDGTLTALTAGGELMLVNDGAGALTVNAALADHTTASALNKSGSGTVALNGPVSHTGATAINEGDLALNSQAPQTLPGVISGAGTLVKNGTNLLHLLAANTYTGPTYVNAGTVRPDQNTAFGATSGGGVFIADGATLDVGCSPDVGGTRGKDGLDLGAKVITAQGVGVDGLGAIVNNSATNQQNALERLVLAGDTLVGGTARWDVRGGSILMNGHTLTKAGPSQFMIVSSDVTPGEGHIDIQSGILRFESSTKLNGSFTNTLTVRSGAELELYRVASAQAWSLTLEDNTTFDAANNSDAANQNRWSGPIELQGAVNLTGGSGYIADLQGPISGSGPLTKTGDANITISGTNNIYTGKTRVQAGTLTVKSLRNVGLPCSLGLPANATDGTISVGNLTTNATLAYTGGGDTTDRVLDFAGTTGGPTINHAGTGPLVFTSEATVSGTGAKTLVTRGTSAPLEFAGRIADGTSSAIALTKRETNDVVLSGNNAYTGVTLLYGGTLTFAGDSACSGEWRVNGGTLVVTGTNQQSAGGIFLGYAAGSNALMRVLPGARVTGTGGVRVGNAANSSGALYVSGGLIDREPATSEDYNFGLGINDNGSYGYLKMTGGAVTNRRFNIGGTGTKVGMGVARVTGGKLRMSEYIIVGRNTNSVGVLTVDGGFIDHTAAGNNISVAHNGGKGELNLTGGEIDSTGRNVTFRQNNVNVATGAVNLCAGLLTLNTFANNSGTAWLNFNGGTLRAAVDSTVFVPSTLTRVTVNGPFGTYAGGAVLDTAGRAVTVAAPLLAPAGRGVSSITLATPGSGYIGEPYVAIEGGGGEGATAVANLEDDGSGTTTRIASITVTTPGWGYTSTPYVSFRGGGSAATPATVAGVTLAANTSGGLTKTGAGVLTLAAVNTYGGATVISNGTLRLGLANALPPNAPVTLAGGTYDLGGFTVTNALTFLGGALTNGVFRMNLSPAGEGVVGAQSLELQAGASVQGTYTADVAADGSSDRVSVSGGINLSGLSLQIVDLDGLNRQQPYTLLSITGARTGAFASTNLTDARWKLFYPEADGDVRLIFVDGTLIKLR